MGLKEQMYGVKLPLRRAVYEEMDRTLLLGRATGDGRDILVIKLDVLGDYLVFRPFLKPLKDKAVANGGKLVLAANSVVAALVRELDGDTVDEFIFLEARGRFLSAPGYHWRVLKQFRRRFAAVYNPTTNRIFECESLVRLAEAPEKVGVEWQERFDRRPTERRADGWYSRLVPVPAVGMFEFERLNVFFSEAAGIRLGPEALRIAIPERPLPVDLQKPYAVLFPGAGFAVREWPVERFAEVARHLATEHGLPVYVAGSPADASKGEAIASTSPAQSLCGQIPLADLPRLVVDARLVVANESGPVHMAACTGTPVVCISNGNHFGWWNPYPEGYGLPVVTVYPDEIERNRNNPEPMYERFGTVSTLPMALIPVEQVVAAADFLLSQIH